jgi:hypothetical protein
VWILAARAISETLASSSSAAATIRSFSARDQRRRRCTDVITSTAFVIGLALVIVLGIAEKGHLGKAAFAGRLLDCRANEFLNNLNRVTKEPDCFAVTS